MVIGQQAQCVVCQKVYTLPTPGEWGQGRHFWTCSENCQRQFVARGGLQAFLADPIAGRKPLGKEHNGTTIS